MLPSANNAGASFSTSKQETFMNTQTHHWHHSPLHVFIPGTIYMVTGATLYQKRIFYDDARLLTLHNVLLEAADKHGWALQAWAVFANHYHFIGRSPEDATTLRTVIRRVHSLTAREANRLAGISGRKVWFQYWDTCITYEKSYLARLNYVHNNPVKHGLVQSAEDYPYCSAAWFRTHAEQEFRQKVESTPYDRVNIMDDF